MGVCILYELYNRTRVNIGVLLMKNITVSPYAVMFLLAFICSFVIVFILLRRKGFPVSFIGYSMFLNLVMTLTGAKLYTVITSGFRQSILTSGISSLGGVIGLLAGTFIFGLIYKAGQKILLQTYCLVIPLMYSIAKIGCYLVGCCHGIPYTGPLAISYDNMVMQGGPYFPVQLAETITFALIFLICLKIYFSEHNNYVVPLVMLLCAVGKFSLEYLREEHIGKILSANQLVCIGFALWGIVLILKNKQTPR